VPANPIGWLTTVARNLILNLARRPAPVALDEVPPSVILEALEGDGLGDEAEIVAVVNGALERMPLAEARLLESFHFVRCRVAQIAAEHGISERAVEGRLRRARERLRVELETTLRQAGGGI
jgi:RNA polymerase sigma-70 factor (ECF subfamily)